jgi:hypothetical protein
MATAQDVTQGTIGWFSSVTGTVGITQGQTARLSVVNVGAVDAVISTGVFQNPTPIVLTQDSFTLRPGHGKELDVKASDVAKEHFDKTGRVQVRAIVRSSSNTVRANLEVFDDQTGKTSVLHSLQELVLDQ